MSEENGEPEVKEEDIPEFGISAATQKVKLGGEIYELRELSGLQRDRYLDEQQKNLKYNQQGTVTGLKTFEGHQVSLIKMGLYQKDEHGAFTRMVPEAVIATFPASTQKELYERLQKMSGLDIKAEERAGNS